MHETDKSGNKYRVTRVSDGTEPAWPHWVLGGRDIHSLPALCAYRNSAVAHGEPQAYIDHIDKRIADFENSGLRDGWRQPADGFVAMPPSGVQPERLAESKPEAISEGPFNQIGDERDIRDGRAPSSGSPLFRHIPLYLASDARGGGNSPTEHPDVRMTPEGIVSDASLAVPTPESRAAIEDVFRTELPDAPGAVILPGTPQPEAEVFPRAGAAESASALLPSVDTTGRAIGPDDVSPEG